MKIVIVGYYGIGNGGDRAILRAMLEGLAARVDDLTLTVLSFNPEETLRFHADLGVDLRVLRVAQKTDFFRTEFRAIGRAYQDADLVLVGGGGMMQDAYNWYTAPYWCSHAFWAKSRGAPTMLFAVGAGPIVFWMTRRLLRLLGRCVDRVTTRDEHSRERLIACGVPPGKIVTTADAVFALKPSPRERAEEILSACDAPAGGSPRIGVSVREVQQWQALPARELAAACDAMAGGTAGRIVFLNVGNYSNTWFGLPPSEPEDIAAIRKIRAHMKTTPCIVTRDVRPQDMLAVVGRMDAMLSMRLHGLVMAARMGVPPFALSYRVDDKLALLMERLDRREDLWWSDAFDPAKVAQRVAAVVRNSTGSTKALKEVARKLAGDAEANFDLALDCTRGPRPGLALRAQYWLTLVLVGALCAVVGLPWRWVRGLVAKLRGAG